jgi:hypothetical protein
MTRAYGLIRNIQSILKTSNNLLDYPPKERMCQKDSRVPVSMGKRKVRLSMYEKFNTKRRGRTKVIKPILPEIVWTGYYIIANKVTISYYKCE